VHESAQRQRHPYQACLVPKLSTEPARSPLARQGGAKCAHRPSLYCQSTMKPSAEQHAGSGSRHGQPCAAGCPHPNSDSWALLLPEHHRSAPWCRLQELGCVERAARAVRGVPKVTEEEMQAHQRGADRGKRNSVTPPSSTAA
jgi:hypothetical protein